MAEPAPPRRALLIGHGPLPGPGCRQSTFGPQRTLAFAHALRQIGVELRIVLVEEGADASPLPPGWAATLRRGRADALAGPLWIGPGPELVVSAGPYTPALIAAHHRGGAPWIADLPGDPFAELQAAEGGAALPAGAAADARAIATRTLAEADHLLVISAPQRLACLGQLGLLGRLGGAAEADRVQICPISAPALGPDGAPLPPRPPRARAPGEPLRVLVGGALNGWQALDALIGGVEQALSAGAPLELHLSGGAGGALAPAQEEQLRAFLHRRSGDPRVIAHGWLAEAELEALEARCHLGLSLDGPGLEPELGSRTRLLRWTWAGLGLLGTARCALAAALAAAGGLREIEARPAAVAAALRALAAGGADPASTVPAAQALIAEIAHPDVALAPLRALARAPSRAPAAALPWAALPAALHAAQAELALIHASPTWRALSRAHRGLRRLRARG